MSFPIEWSLFSLQASGVGMIDRWQRQYAISVLFQDDSHRTIYMPEEWRFS